MIKRIPYHRMIDLRRRREALGMSQGDLAKASGISAVYLHSLEIGKRANPAATVVDAIEQALGRLEAAQPREASA